MSNQELDISFPVPVPEKKECKYCHRSHPELYWDDGLEAYYHEECLNRNIDMEIKEALLRSKISFDDLKRPTGGKY